ncbi:MAG: hypothetical protein WC829_05975 [Hyphomicrobium sp.]
MSFNSVRTLLLAIAAIALPMLASAQTIPKEMGAARTVGLFNFLCLKHLPDLDGIERAAGFGEFDQLLNGDLVPYMPEIAHEALRGWRYHDHGEEYILTALRSRADAAVGQQMPAFAGAAGTTCSLRVPNTQPEPVLGELTRVMGRAADKTWQEGATRVYSWTHQQPDALSFVHYYVPESKGAKAVIEASVYLNK